MPSVLIVEDDDAVREMLRLLLRSHGYETFLASNGEDGLATMRERKPCLVLLDIQMPIVSGWEFRQRQLEDPELAGVPVLCLTGMFDPEDVVRKLGIPCLAKPVRFPEVLHEVEAACGLPSDSA